MPLFGKDTVIWGELNFIRTINQNIKKFKQKQL